jgi:hypothetical protein
MKLRSIKVELNEIYSDNNGTAKNVVEIFYIRVGIGETNKKVPKIKVRCRKQQKKYKYVKRKNNRK